MTDNTLMYKERTCGETLKLLMRRKDGISENALARATGVNQPTIHRILVGDSKNPSTKNLQPLCTYFGVSLDQITGKTPIQGIDGGDVSERPSSPGIKLDRERYGSDDEARLLKAYRSLRGDQQSTLLAFIEAMALPGIELKVPWPTANDPDKSGVVTHKK